MTPTKLLFTKGNLKLPKDTFILNMGSATDCPSRKLGLCKHSNICYAMKAERTYPAVLPYRRKQAEQWDALDADTIAAKLWEASRRSKRPMKALRFSEAGDFRTQDDVDKMARLGSLLADEGINCYGYTARRDLNFKGLMSFAVVQGSGFMLSNNFQVYKKGDTLIKEFDMLCPGDCRECSVCQVHGGLTIGVLAH